MKKREEGSGPASIAGSHNTYEKKMVITDIGDHTPVRAALRVW